MTTFTVPKLFPQLFAAETNTRQIAKASLIRKIAMAQNYIWSRAIRIYANGGYEGHGSLLHHIASGFDPKIPGNPNLQGASDLNDTSGSMYRDQEVLPDGQHGLCLSSFLVPPNWGTSRRILVQGEYTFQGGEWVNGELVNEADIWVLICRRDGSVYSYRRWSDTHGGPIRDAVVNEDFSIEVEVPQDTTYVARVFIQHLDHSTPTNNANFAVLQDTTHYIEVRWISSRYDVANEAESNDSIGQAWVPYADFFRNDMPVASVFLAALVHNTQHLAGSRPLELCQVWLAEHWTVSGPLSTVNPLMGVELGHYKFWTPSCVTKMKGKLYISSQRIGAGNYVEVKLNGVVIFTYNIVTSNFFYEVSVDEFTVPAGAENEITINAYSSQYIDENISHSYLPIAGTSGWGVQVNAVSFWESGTTLNLPAGTTVPDEYRPIDEDAIEGDDVITAEDLNAFGQRSGIRRLFDNDRWLAFNRLRHVVGDWRHRALKRGGELPPAGSGDYDLRMQWTPDAQYPFPGRMKNITVRGEPFAAIPLGGTDWTVDKLCGEGGRGYGQPSVISGYSSAPYLWPNTLSYKQHGRLIGRFYAVRPTDVDTHIGALGNMRLAFYARRLRPFQFSADSNGGGPGGEEGSFIGKGFLDVDINGVSYQMPINSPPGSSDVSGVAAVPGDTVPHWINDLILPHSDEDVVFQVRGRLPRQPVTIDTNEFAGRPEGMLFEIELLGWYIADEPLPEDRLQDLFP